MVKSAKSTSKKDPFKTRTTKQAPAKVDDTLSPPAEVASAIDQFRECQEQAKHFDGEATVYKDQITEYARQAFAGRVFDGNKKSFKVLGDETMVTYVVMDSSAGLTEEDVEDIRQRFGDEAADELVERDFASIRFDPKVLEAHYDDVVGALQGLPDEVLDKLFRPMLMRASTGAVDKIRKHAKTQEEFLELVKALKVKNYIR